MVACFRPSLSWTGKLS